VRPSIQRSACTSQPFDSVHRPETAGFDAAMIFLDAEVERVGQLAEADLLGVLEEQLHVLVQRALIALQSQLRKRLIIGLRAKRLHVAADSLVEYYGLLERCSVGEPGVVIDRPHQFAQRQCPVPARARLHSVLRDRERATELREAIASLFAADRQTEPTMGHLLGKPEAGAGIAIMELNRHFDIDLGGPETVQFRLFRPASTPDSKRRTAAKK